MAHGTFVVDGTKVGTVIDAAAGHITNILFTGAPTQWEIPNFDSNGLPNQGYFSLVDNSVTPPRVLFQLNGHVGGGHSPHATHQQMAYSIPFGSLFVNSVTKGATYSVTTTA